VGTLYLHIGLVKTGTTAIQHALKELAPTSPWRYRPESEYWLRSPEPPKRWVSSVLRDLKSADVVLSNEMFLERRLLVSDPTTEVERTLRLMRAFAWSEIVIVLTVRPLNRWAESLCEYSQLTKASNERQSASEFFASFLADKECDPLIPFLETLLEELGEECVRVVPYSASNIVGDFFSLLGLSDGGPMTFLAERRANVTNPAPVAAMAARIESRRGRQQQWVTRELMTHVLWPDEPVNFSPFTADEQRHLALITSNSAESLQNLQGRFRRSFGDFDDWIELCRDVKPRLGPESPEFEEYSRACREVLIQHLIARETGGLLSLLRRPKRGFLSWVKVMFFWAPRAVLKKPLRTATRFFRGY